MIDEPADDVDWRAQVAAQRWPSSAVLERQAVWDAAWQPVYEQGLTAGMPPGKAAIRAWRLTRMRHGERPEETCERP